MADVLVVGGNGFIGSHVVDALVARGHTVAAFDRFGPQPPLWSASGVRPIVGDFLNGDDVRRAVEGQEMVLHLLSTTDPATSEGDPTLDVRTNILSSIGMFSACAAAGVQKVYFASTGGAIYGDQPQTVFRETDLTLPVSPYAIGKLTIENYLRYFRRTQGLDSTVFRISNPYGPRQNPRKRQGVIPIFLRQIAAGEPLTVFGDGSMVRDYVYVADVAEMIAQAVTEGTSTDLYNLGSGVGLRLTELLSAIREVTGIESTVHHKPQPPTFVDHVTLDTSRFSEEFGAPRLTSLHDGIARTWQEIGAARD
ncbi:UDP-glucose 4-epimerase [Actinotalea ferrariae CF5-4]|uniref:UDP-glucose 4-epimerase n=1 Tax=Actinotalea ferrariae CF5-4 TaxID=948458 RepID=A0A021VUF4_9CELL|nr:NAD-dependent epimerase/dehydratase family protein [Actinotalea ferrariae]EYR64781.1 UDP-glucose 4-epimerase [Actinotalea ferrariae CF5-4]